MNYGIMYMQAMNKINTINYDKCFLNPVDFAVVVLVAFLYFSSHAEAMENPRTVTQRLTISFKTSWAASSDSMSVATKIVRYHSS